MKKLLVLLAVIPSLGVAQGLVDQGRASKVTATASDGAVAVSIPNKAIVAVGTTTPTAPPAGTAAVEINSTAANTSGQLIFQIGGSQASRIGHFSNVLTFQDLGGTGMKFDEQSNYPITFGTNAADRMRIPKNGGLTLIPQALPTCGATDTPEGTIVMVAGVTATKTKMCVCTYTPTGTVYAWVNALLNNAGTGVGNTTTCP